MNGREVVLIGGAIGLIALAILLSSQWANWRKRRLTEAGEAFGFRRLASGESLSMPLVPLIERANRTYLLIMKGMLNGYESAFFDLYSTWGKDWDYQSALLMRNPTVNMPRFQLLTPQMLQTSQRSCRETVTLPGREADMGPLKLSCDDPQWARRVFSQMPAEFFGKVREGNWTIEGVGHSLVVYCWGTRISAGRLREYLQQAGDLAAQAFSFYA